MGVAFLRGQQLGRSDLNIFLDNTSGTAVNAAEISYALYDFTTGQEVLLGAPRRTPVNSSVGEYYVSIIIPLDANLGAYRIRWTFRETVGGPIQSVVQEFEVLDRETQARPTFTFIETDLIHRLRTLLRDQNPARNYRFRPPSHEETISQYNRVFGFVWEEQELLEYLEASMDMVIAAPPRTPFSDLDSMLQSRREWRTVLLTGAMIYALQALQINWVQEEFSVGPETMLQVHLPKGRVVDLTIEDLHRACYGEESSELQDLFWASNLKVRSVDASGKVLLKTLGDVTRHSPVGKKILRLSLETGAIITVTEDHSLYTGLEPVKAGDLKVGSPVTIVAGNECRQAAIESISEIEGIPYVYDLCVPGPENFVVENGILAHNSYSIGGVSLDLEKSSKFESAKQGASELFDKQLEKAKLTVKVTKGLQQPRYGTGIRSAFGPFQSRGVISPAKFVGF